jgi:hypothetical protein
MSASLASAATAATESKQQRAPPAPVPSLSQFAKSPIGCSAFDYEELLADALGLLYDCARQGKVDVIQVIVDVWSQRRLHLACANGHAGWTYVHKAKKHNNQPTTMETTTTRRGRNAEILGDPYSKKSPLPSVGTSSCLAISPTDTNYRLLGQARNTTHHNHPPVILAQ